MAAKTVYKILNEICSKAKITPEGKPSIRRNFMQNSMEQYLEVMKKTNIEMAQELDRMPIGKFHFNHIFSNNSTRRRLTTEGNPIENVRNSFSSNVSTVLLRFKNRSWEWSYMREPDLMLKYSTLMGFIVFIAILLMQTLNNASGITFWILNGITATIITMFIPITWFKKLWIISRAGSEDDPDMVNPPSNMFFKYLYTTSRNIIRNAIARTIIYLITVVLLISCSLIHLVECYDEIEAILIENNGNTTVSEMKYSPCLNVWVITQSLILAICLNFLFVRVNFVLKLFVGSIIVAIYAWIIFVEFHFIYALSSSINASLDANISHILIVLFIFIIFHMIDRQTEYISRVDYNWKQQLQMKQAEAEFTKDTIKVLVQNILPAHVAEIYMSRQIKDELYYEEYENVAIMFATIINFDVQSDAPVNSEKNILSILNRIICDFDEKLIAQTGTIKIEKIKVAGWTYMVACGLDPGRADSAASLFGNRGLSLQRSSLLSNGRRSWNTTRTHSKYEKQITVDETDLNSEEISPNSRQNRNAVYVLAQFALEIMSALNNFNQENFKADGLLRIGISHGKVMAGVVGSKKPLYDVWGNAVNMASRMDSTGIPGKIQVTSETAEVLHSFGIKCDYRGKTFVKGRGSIPTYFACVNDQYHFENTTEKKLEMDNRKIIYNTRL